MKKQFEFPYITFVHRIGFFEAALRRDWRALLIGQLDFELFGILSYCSYWTAPPLQRAS